MTSELEYELRGALRAQVDVTTRLMLDAKFTAQDIMDCTSQAKRVLTMSSEDLNHLGRDQWQDALDTWAKENLPIESAGCITSWSDRIAEFICSRLATEGRT